MLYAFEDKLDKLPEWMLFKGWNTRILENYTPTDSYAFEIYYLKSAHRLPPKEYFNKNFDEYYLNPDIINSGLYLDFDITPLKEFVSEKSFNRMLIDQIE